MLSIIVAASENNVIGKDGTLPWHLPKDLKYFKKITSGHAIVMGRTTYESIGRPLPNRRNIILTRDITFSAKGCDVIHSIDDIPNTSEEIFIIGGANVYQQTLDMCDRLYFTRVHTHIEGDAYFPEINETIWKLESSEKEPANENNEFDLSFITYIKK